MVSDEEPAQVARLRYHLAHSVKEGLVDQMKRWPGIHFAKSLLGGKPLKGLWFNRTAEFFTVDACGVFPTLATPIMTLTLLPAAQHYLLPVSECG